MATPKGFHWSVDARRARSLEKRRNQPYDGTFFAKVASPLENERVFVQGALGDKIINFAYPFSSPNAWIRGQPEVDTTMLTLVGADSREMHPVGYFDGTKAGVVAKYETAASQLRENPTAEIADLIPYRALQPGDVDTASNFAQTFHGLKDVVQARGGLSHLSLTSKAASIDTPLFQVHGPAYRVSGSLTDEVRFGVVRRATSSSSPTFPALVRSSQASVRNPTVTAFAKEHSVVLTSYGTPPLAGKLIDHRQGNVVEDNGDLATSDATGQELRARYRWFSSGSETKAEIDQSGNWSLSTAIDALSGGQVSIQSGPFNMDVGRSFSAKVNQDIQFTSSIGSFIATATAGFRISTAASNGVIESLTGLRVTSQGAVVIESALPLGIRLGSPSLGVPLPQYPILIANPTYVGTLQGWLGAESAFDGVIGSYGATAAAAWSAIGALVSLIDPTATVPSLCLSAAAAATAMSASAPIVTGAISAHLPTLGMNPAGFQSLKTVSE
jgi:hypothetical protein